MRAKSILLLVLALGCGLIAAIGVTQVISQDGGGAKTTGETVNILVAKEDILEGKKLTPQLVKVEAWPKEKVPVGVMTDVAAIDGMRVKSDILVDEPIRMKKLYGKDDVRTPTDRIDANMRAVPIKIEKDSNAGLIRPGDRVDVLANLRKNVQQGIPSSRTITLLQNVEVFAVDDVFRTDPENEGGEGTNARTVTLVLTPKQAVKVDLAQVLGKLRIIMRSPDDEGVSEKTPDISIEELLGTATPEPVPMPTAKPKENKMVAVVQTPLPTNDTWKMRILTGAGVSDLILEERDGNGGKKVWRVSQEGEEEKAGTASSSPSTITSMPLGPMIDDSLVPPGLELTDEPTADEPTADEPTADEPTADDDVKENADESTEDGTDDSAEENADENAA